jgi:hypothetical protein
METPNQVESAFFRLRRAGWSIGAVASVTDQRRMVWVVAGIRGEAVLRAEADTQSGAWQLALAKAEAAGLATR